MKLVARLGDRHICGNPDHSPNHIASGGKTIVEGQPVARIGDACSCGAKIIEGASGSFDDNKAIAYDGCKTQCGPYTGYISAGARFTKVRP